MAATETPIQLVRLRRRWSSAEKRRLVELTLVDGASVTKVALAHGVHPTSLSHWRSLYRSGKLPARSPQNCSSASASRTTLLPVTISSGHAAPAPSSKTAVRSTLRARLREYTIVHVALPSGATFRVEAEALDSTLVCSLLAGLRR